MAKMPVLFVGHGSPMNAIEQNEFSDAWAMLGASLPRPKAILAVSAHWFTRGTFVGDSPAPRLVYDMYGFPDELYRVRYPAPGSPETARRALSLLGGDATVDNSWGIDHGTWSVLRWMFPAADIPLMQLSVNAQLTPAEQYEIGVRLRPLRDEGVLLFASGNIVHNLSRVSWGMKGGFPWADEFDKTIRSAILAGDHSAVINYRTGGESALLSVPTIDHYAPLLYALGAREESDQTEPFCERRVLGSLSMTGYLFS